MNLKKFLLVGMLFIVAFGLRLGLLGAWYQAGQGERLSSDTTLFLEMAQGVAEGKGFLAFGQPSMRRVPLYPLFLAFFIKIQAFPLGVQLFQCLLGALSCMVVFFMARECGFSDRVAWIAAILMTLDYMMAKQCVYVLPEMVYLFWVVLTYFFLFRGLRKDGYRDFVIAGLAAGFSVLTKESLSLFYPALAGLLVLARIHQLKRWKQALLFGVFYLMVLTPWVARNVLLFKRPVFLTQSAGLTVYLGNNPTVQPQLFGGEWRAGIETQYPAEEQTLVSEVYGATDKNYLQQAFDFIRQEPVFFIKNAAIKLIRLWYPFYSEAPLAIKIYTGIMTIFIYSLAWCGAIWIAGRSAVVYAYPLIAYLSLVHAVTLPTIRYRYVLMPFLMILAAAAIEKIMAYYGQKRLK